MKNGVLQPTIQGQPASIGSEYQLRALVPGSDHWEAGMINGNTLNFQADIGLTDIKVHCPKQGSNHVIYKVQTRLSNDAGTITSTEVHYFFGQIGVQCSIPLVQGNNYPDQIHGAKLTPAHSRPPLP